MTTARQKVLTFFSKTRTASAREIARALKMSEATVRHHLRVLTSDGRLELSEAREQRGKGRPEKKYSVPSAALGDNLAALSDLLLTEAGSSLQMDDLGKRLMNESNLTGQPLGKRLSLLVQKLNEMHYHARWEAGSEGPRFIFTHCPYAAILAKHPELCKMDATILREGMGQPARQISKTGTDGSSVCVFVIGR